MTARECEKYEFMTTHNTRLGRNVTKHHPHREKNENSVAEARPMVHPWGDTPVMPMFRLQTF
jgi:hypothetical protein